MGSGNQIPSLYSSKLWNPFPGAFEPSSRIMSGSLWTLCSALCLHDSAGASCEYPVLRRYVRYTRRWRKKCTVLHRIQWRIWWCTEFGDKFSTDFFTVLKKAYFSMTILSLNSVMIYWRLIHHWIRWWKLVYFLLWFFGSPNSVHMFALKLMKMILVKILAPNSVKNYVLHWIPWQIKNTSHAHNVCF